MKLKFNILVIFLIILFCITKQINTYIILMLFVFLHELAHIAVGKLLKLKINYLELMPFGISVKLESVFYKYYLEEYEVKKITSCIKNILVSIAGPILNILLAIIISIYNINIQNFSAEMLIYTNILIAIFNLLPIYPLDGGRILEAFLNIYINPLRTKQIIYIITQITMIILTLISSILVYYYQNIWIFLGILYMWIAVIKRD